jgi:hypothetical protein
MVAKRKKYTFLIFTLILPLINGCFDTYKPVERRVNVEPFTTIHLESVFSVVLTQSNEYYVDIIADEDVMSEIHAEVRDGMLELKNNSKYKWTAPESAHIKVVISAPSFRNFHADQSYALSNEGELIIDEFNIVNYPEVKISEVDLNVNGRYFFYWNNWLAGGKLKLRGQIQTLYASNYALHIIDARDLASENATLHNFGRETCTVNVSNHFEYSLNGPGNIVLFGNPAQRVLLEKTSTGKLVEGH